MDLRGPVHRGAAVPLPASWREGGKDGESREWLLLLVLVLVLLQRRSLFVLYCPSLFFCCYYHTLSSLSTYLALRRCTLFYSSLVLCLCSNCLPTTGRCVDPRLLALVHLAPHFQDPALLLRSGRDTYQSPARTDAPIPNHPTTPAGTELRYTRSIASAIPPRLPPRLRPTSGRLFKRGNRGLSSTVPSSSFSTRAPLPTYGTAPPRCVTILRSSTSVGTSGLSSGHGARITRRHIDAARRLWWLLNSGTCEILHFPTLARPPALPCTCSIC
jgi:hypothetical protein